MKHTKTSQYRNWLIAACLCVVVFGFGYLFGKAPIMPTRETRPVSSQTPSPTQHPSSPPTTTAIPDLSPPTSPLTQASTAPTYSLTYSIPTGWVIASDNTNTLSMAYDPNRYSSDPNPNIVLLEGKWVTEGSSSRRLGSTRAVQRVAYNGGSRHAALFAYLHIDGTQSDWKSPQYAERNYRYNTWNCLVINGIMLSQYEGAWAFCPISNTQGLVLSFDTKTWSEIEQQLATVRVTQ